MTPWSDIAPIIKRRREVLGFTQQQLADRANVLMGAQVLSAANLGVIEAGTERDYRPRTLIGLARALGWTDDTMDRLRDGEDPIVSPAADPRQDAERVANRIELEEERRLDRQVALERERQERDHLMEVAATQPAGVSRRWGELSEEDQAAINAMIERLAAK